MVFNSPEFHLTGVSMFSCTLMSLGYHVTAVVQVKEQTDEAEPYFSRFARFFLGRRDGVFFFSLVLCFESHSFDISTPGRTLCIEGGFLRPLSASVPTS